MKVHLHLPTLAGGGAERVFVRLANHYAEIGLPTCLILNSATGPLLQLLDERVKLVDLKAPRIVVAMPRLARYLRREHPPVLLSALTTNNLAALLARIISGVDTRVVISERNHFSALSGFDRRFKRTVTAYLIRALYRHADAIIAVSSGVAADLARVARVPLDRIHVIENPVPDADEIARSRQADCPHPWFEDGSTVIVSIGRLMPQKGYPALLEALALARSSGRDLRLIVLGDGPQLAELTDLSETLGIGPSVCFGGFVMNRLDYLVRASLYVLSSETEGFPNALIEAIACGVPVVSTDCAGGGPRAIIGADVDAALVPVNDPQALAAAMIDQLDHPPTPHVLAAIAQRYSFERTAERYLEVLRGS